MDVVYRRTLHKGQRDIFDDHSRFRVVCAGRRFGKSRLVLDELVRASLSFDGTMSPTSPQVVLGTLPTAVQARAILFKPLVKLFTETSLKYVVEDINLTSMSITISGKPTILIAGANDRNGDRLRGKRIYFICMDEVQDTSVVAFTEVVRPAMSDTPGSRALLVGTPKGRSNFLFTLSEMEKTDKDWKFFNQPTEANPTIPREEIATARASMPPRVFAQEYLAEFTVFPGQIWTHLDSLNEVGSTEVPTCDLVVMGVDMGDRHPAAIVVGRESRSMKWYILDAWSPNTSGKESQPVPRAVFDSTIAGLVRKYHVDAVYCDPSRPSEILAIRDQGHEKGFKNCVAGFNAIQSGISQIDKLIWQNNLLIPTFTKNDQEKAKGFLDSKQLTDFMLSYHWITNKAGEVTEEPADGSFSHICDALRYALAVKGG